MNNSAIEKWKEDYSKSVYYVYFQFYKGMDFLAGFTVPLSIN